MISLKVLEVAIRESRRLDPKKSIKRPKYLNLLKKASENMLIKAIVGFRRAGKSYLLKMLSKSLVSNGVPEENIFFLNFENDLLNKVRTVKQLRILWEMYLQNIPNTKKQIYIIWDEVQLVKNWEKLVRTLYEQGIYNIFISGSNSQLLSGELGSSLSGRCLEFEILPFSFSEFLESKKIKFDRYFGDKKEEIDKALNIYLRRGGLPEQFELNGELSEKYIDNLIQKILLDDIVNRYKIIGINTLKEIFDFVKGNITSTTSLRKISERLKNQDIPVSVTTIDNYLYYWQTSYALSRLSKFDYQIKRIFDKTNKYYVIDSILIPGREENDEKRLENMIFLELVRRYGRKNIWYGQNENKYEVDFLVDKEDKREVFQVCMNLTDENSKREFGNIELVKKYLKNTQGNVLYLNDQRINFENQNAKSVIEWLLE